MLHKEEMVIPYATNQGIRIHYQVAGEGSPLVLQHGFAQSLESWDYVRYVHTLQYDYQLILGVKVSGRAV